MQKYYLFGDYSSRFILKKSHLWLMFFLFSSCFNATLWAQTTVPNVFFNAYGQEMEDIFSQIEYVPKEKAFFAIGTEYDQARNFYQGTFSKIDLNGNLLWTHSYGTDTRLFNFAYTDDGHFILMGRKGLSNNKYSVYLVETDATGSLIQSKTLARSGRIQGLHMIKNQDDSKGETYTVAYWKSNGGTSDDMGICKVNRNFDILWSADYYFSGDDQVTSMIPISNGGCMLTGQSSGLSWNGFVYALDADGKALGARRFVPTGVFGYFEIRQARMTQDNNLVLVGQDANADAYIFKLDISTNDISVIWAKRYGHYEYKNTFSSLIEDTHGNLYATAYLSFDDTKRLSVFKFKSDGHLIWAKHLGEAEANINYRAKALIAHTGTNPDRLILRDIRNTKGGFGERDAVVAVLDTDLNSCETIEFQPLFKDTRIDIKELNIGQSDVSYTFNRDDLFSSLDYQQKLICNFAPHTFANCYGDSLNNVISQVEYVMGKQAFFATGYRELSNGIYEGTFSKLDIDGNILWTKGYGINTILTSFVQREDGHFMLLGRKGTTTNNYSVYMIVVDDSGNLIFDKTYARSGRFREIELVKTKSDPSGESYLIRHLISGGGSSDDISVMKIDANGVLKWSYDYVISGDDENKDIIPLDGGGCLLVGAASGIGWHGFLIELSHKGEVLHSNQYFENSNQQFQFYKGVTTKDGGFVLVGQSGTTERDALIVKVDANLDVKWSNIYPLTTFNFHRNVVEDIDGNIYVSSHDDIDGASRLRIFKYSPNGQLLKAVHFEPSNYGVNAGTFMSHTNTSPDRIILRDSPQTQGGFGLNDASIHVLNTDLESCQTTEYPVTVEPITASKVALNITRTATTYTENTDGYHATIDYQQKGLCQPTAGPLTFIVGENCGSVGDMVQIPVSVENFTTVNGFQYSVHVDPNLATINSVSGFGLPNWSTSNFTINSSTGTITLTWEAPDVTAGASVANETIIFYIDVEIVGSPNTTSAAYIDDNPTPVAVAQNLEEVTPVLVSGNLCVHPNVSIGGQVYTSWDNSPICNAKISLNNVATQTQQAGTYQFNSLLAGSDYSITASKSDSPTNGVNIFDVIAIRQHILEEILLCEAYQFIAADVTGDQEISIIDIIVIKQVIQGTIPNFPNNKSWRFIPHDVFFTSNEDIFPFPQSRNYNNLTTNQHHQNFKGIKIGDVTGNASGDCTPLAGDEVEGF